MKKSFNMVRYLLHPFKIPVIFLIIRFLTMSPADAQDGAPLSLSQLLDSALQNNYVLKAYRKNTLIKKAEIDLLKTNYQPDISLSADISYWKFLMPNKQKLLGSSLSDVYTDISVRQTIYDWGENKARKSLVEEEILLNDEMIRQIRHTIMWGVADTYFEVLKVRSEAEIHRNTLSQLHSQLQFAEHRFEIGKASSLDLLKIRVQIFVEEKNLQQAMHAIKAEEVKIRRLCYLRDTISIHLAGTARDLYEHMEKPGARSRHPVPAGLPAPPSPAGNRQENQPSGRAKGNIPSGKPAGNILLWYWKLGARLYSLWWQFQLQHRGRNKIHHPLLGRKRP
ncbi:MAG TPA: hypothetical protein ENN63_05930 [Bacteroidetes bacterium]|nr:hypothetical protein [Bacteroidota bacterium]